MKLKHLVKHETKLHVLFKFLAVFLVFAAYFGFVSHKYGLEDGIFVTLLTWSFFVLCTPVADAGFLLDFPLRLIAKIKMFTSEIFVWIVAIGINLYSFNFIPETYDKTNILVLFKHILSNPVPFWLVILLSMIGTFASVYFGDELMDNIKHEDRTKYHKHKYNYRIVVFVFVLVAVIGMYDFLIKELGVGADLMSLLF